MSASATESLPPAGGRAAPGGSSQAGDERRAGAMSEHRRLVREHRQREEKLRELRLSIRAFQQQYNKSEDDIKALQSVGQIIGEVLKKLDGGGDRYIVKSSNGPRYIVGCRPRLLEEAASALALAAEREAKERGGNSSSSSSATSKKDDCLVASVKAGHLVQGTRVTLDMTTLTIMKILPREVDPLVYNMSAESPGEVSFEEIGGLAEQVRQLREVVELPILNPELFERVGVRAPKGVLLYGPPGTGKTLLARAVAKTLDINFLKVVSSAIVDKYIGESARIVREMFTYAKEHAPCIIFMDEIDAIGGRRFSEGNSSDREVQRTLMELLNQMDGFDELGQVKLIMATNRPDVLDPALLRPGRLDRKIEIPLPNEQGRLDILKIHSARVATSGTIDLEAIVKLSDSFNGADLRNVCTEAGMFALREERDHVVQEDLLKAVRKMADAKKLESKLEYAKV